MKSLKERATDGSLWHHATAEAIRTGLTLYLSIDGEPIADQIADSLAEDLMMYDDRTRVAEILAHAEIGVDDIEEMIAAGVRKMAAKAATRVQRLDPAKLPEDCRETLATLRERAWQKSADEAADTCNGQMPPSALRSQLGRAAWDGFEPAPITGREAIEIHGRTPGSRLMVRTPEGPEPITVDEAWKVIEHDPGAVYVDKPDYSSWSGKPHRIAIVAVRRPQVPAATETIKAAARQLTRPGADDFSEPATVWEITGHNVPGGLVGLEVSTEVPKADVDRARKACEAYPGAVCPS